MSNTLSSQLTDDMKAAMRAKDTKALTVIRNLKSALKYAAIEKHGADATEPDDAEAIAVVRKQIKQRQDSIASYQEANRPDLAEIEQSEIAVLEKYLPQPLSEAEIEKLVDEAIAQTGATTRKDMGNVMKILQQTTGGRADGKTLSTAVGKRLG